MNPQIFFTTHQVSYELPNPEQWATWLEQVGLDHGKQVEALTYIFSSDAYLHRINTEHLSHDTFTDVITFGLGENPKKIEGEIYISIERVKENAKHFGVPFLQELGRVMVHGLLHLLGYQDGDPEEQRKMRKKEDHYLHLSSFSSLWQEKMS